MLEELDAVTLARARRGDERAFERLVRHYDPGLRALAFRLLGDRARMDDALQEAYVKAYRALPRFRGDASFSLSYSRGVDQFLVTTRLRGDGTWSDPLASPEGYVDTPTDVGLAAGALAGAEAQLVVSPQTVPHLWALTGNLVVTVGGNLDRAELTRIATSLREG